MGGTVFVGTGKAAIGSDHRVVGVGGTNSALFECLSALHRAQTIPKSTVAHPWSSAWRVGGR